MSIAAGVIAVDLGATNLRAAAVGRSGELSCRVGRATDAESGPDAVVERMAAAIAEVAAAAGLGADVPVGVAAPGPLDPRTGVVLFTPNLPGWRGYPLGARLSEATGRGVRLGNDGNCAVLGEARFGAGVGARDIVYLALGTGVGGGVIAEGVLVEGAQGLGAELGHVVVAMDGPRCTCGSIGCLEAFASGWAIAREAEFVAATVDGAGLRDMAAGQPMTAGVVMKAALAGDVAATAIFDRAGRALGAAIGAFINIFNPELVVIGGGLAHLGDLILQPAHEMILRHSFRAQRERAKLVMSALGDDTGLYGAAALALGAVDDTSR